MKKIITVLLTLTLIISATACGSGESGNSTSTDTSVSTPVETSTETSTEVSSETSAEVIEATDSTVGEKYLAAFSSSAATTAGDSVDELIALGAFEADLVRMDVSEGYLNGFTEEIKGFSSGSMFSPMIGSIPFVGYVFESENPDALLNLLTSCSDPAWNICTYADETVSFVKGNLVFFLMCTNEE